MKKSILLFAVAFAAMLTGCGTPPSIVHEPTTARPRLAEPAAPRDGAIFQAAAYRPMFEDRRARLVGDIVTISISEKTSAEKSGASSGAKSGSTSNTVSSLFGVPPSTLAQLSLSSKSANTFEDKNAASSSNSFTGMLTATVTDVLPNGNLVVAGEKQIAFDKGSEYVRFSGVISPDTIAEGNIVSSTQVADVRVEYRTNSRIDRSEFMSQIARFFMSVLPF